MNKRGQKPKSLQSNDADNSAPKREYNDILDDNNLNRFDSPRRKRNKNRKNKPMQK